MIRDESLPSDAAPLEEPALGRRFLRPRTLISFVVGLAIVGFILSRMNIDVTGSLAIIRRANWVLYVTAILVYYTVFVSRGWRWRVMLENTGAKRQDLPGILGLGEIIYLSWFTNSLLPAKLGDVYRAYLLRSRSALTFTKVGGTIIAERILDVAILIVLLGASALASFHGAIPPELVPATEVGLVVILLALAGIVVLARLDTRIRRQVPIRLVRAYDNVREGTVGAFGAYPWLVGLSLFAWLGEVGRLYFVTLALGYSLSPNPVTNLVEVAFVAFAAAMLSAVPLTPGGLGFVDGGMVGALTLLNPSPDAASAISSIWILDRSISFGSLIVGGLIVYVASHRHHT